MRKALFMLGILSDSDIDWMVAAGRRQQVPRGSTLIYEGRPIEALHVVLDGVLSVRVSSLGGREIARLRCGEVVGEISFVDARPPSASVVAAEDAVVLSIARAQLVARLREPEFAARFYRALSVFLADRLRATVRSLGYGREDVVRPLEDDEELDSQVLEDVGMAGARFEWLLERLRGA